MEEMKQGNGSEKLGVAPHPQGGATPSGRDGGEASGEVREKAQRRRFTREYKQKILREAGACREPGEVGSLVRREGLYSSALTAWRRQRDRGGLEGKRGKKPTPHEDLIEENKRLRRENTRLAQKLKQAETIIEIQKKASEMMGIPLSPPESEGRDE